jgi:hypothetical protein
MPWIQTADNLTEISASEEFAASEAAALADMKRAQRPFDRPRVEPKQGWEFPRAGVRLRADGRAQLRIWLDPTMPDPVQGGACSTPAEAFDLGAMIVQFARDAGT